MTPSIRIPMFRPVAIAAAAVFCCGAASAAPVRVTVTVSNLAAPNSVSFAPLHVGFGAGVFDAFNIGQVANQATISVAEGGGGSDWQAAFAAAEPLATRGTIGGLLQPGESQQSTFLVDSVTNPFFTFGSMVVPSNDFFIGNDSPTRFRLLDAAGTLLINEIGQLASDIWDAGSELFDPAAAAFVGNNGLRTPQNGVVSFDFAELAGFNGLTTATGYVFNSGLSRDTPIYRISFAAAVVPEPGSMLLAAAALAAVWFSAGRRREGRRGRGNSGAGPTFMPA